MHINPTFRAYESIETGRSGQAGRPTPVTLYRSDEVIYAQGDVAESLYRIEFGTVRICRISADGRRQISAFLGAGDVIGLEAGREHDSYAEAVDEVGLRPISLPEGAEGTVLMLSLALGQLAHAHEHHMILGRRSASERLAALLLELSERQGHSCRVSVPMQRIDIADYLGLTFETVSRALRALKEAGTVKVHSTYDIELTDRPALEDMCA